MNELDDVGRARRQLALMLAGLPMAGALHAAGLVDEWVAFLAPMLCGGPVPALAGRQTLLQLVTGPKLLQTEMCFQSCFRGPRVVIPKNWQLMNQRRRIRVAGLIQVPDMLYRHLMVR